jgi:hypothetical protein
MYIIHVIYIYTSLQTFYNDFMINKVNKARKLKNSCVFKLLKKFFSFRKETFYIIALVTGGLFFSVFTFYILLYFPPEWINTLEQINQRYLHFAH